MHLYSLTLQRPSAITHAVRGNFSGRGNDEIVVAHGRCIELLQIDEQGRILSLCNMDCFAIIRALAASKLPGYDKDCIFLTSDSGKLAMVEYNYNMNQFERIYLETYGRSGCRRMVPGQHLAIDSYGRALVIGSLEKNVVGFQLQLDDANQIVLLPPIRSSSPQRVFVCFTSLDRREDLPPMFASIEVDYVDNSADELQEAVVTSKRVCFYEIDAGSNTMEVRYNDFIDNSSNLLIPVFNQLSGLFGVLICAENKIALKSPVTDEVVLLIPRRNMLALEQSLMITSYVLMGIQDDMSIFFAQNDIGDLYKITVSLRESVESVLGIEYLDTLPVAQSMIIVRDQYLMLCSEFGNHMLLSFSALEISQVISTIELSTVQFDDESIDIPNFLPHNLQYFRVVEEVESLSPIVGMKVMDMYSEGNFQLFTLCGKGPRSSIRVLRHGLSVVEMAISQLPTVPVAVWTLKANSTDEHDKYIVVSLAHSSVQTLVLSIGETVEAVANHGLLPHEKSISIATMGDCMIQVHTKGIQVMKGGKNIPSPFQSSNPVILSANNELQMLVTQTDGVTSYLEMESSGTLREKGKININAQEVCGVELTPLSASQGLGKFAVMGAFVDNAWFLCVVSLEVSTFSTVVGRQVLQTRPSSIALLPSYARSSREPGRSVQFLYVGLENGVLMRMSFNPETGEISQEFRTRSLGSNPVKLVRVKVQGKDALLALSSRSWLAYHHQGKQCLDPLSYDMLDFAWNFSSQQCPEGFVCISQGSLRILSLERVGEIFSQSTAKLAHTPRQCAPIKGSTMMIVIESDHNTDKNKALQDGANKVDQEAQAAEGEKLSYEMFGAQRAGNGSWASSLRVLDMDNLVSRQIINYSEEEAALSLCSTSGANGENLVLVGTSVGLRMGETHAASGFVYTYTVSGSHLHLEHKTPVDGIPRAICSYQGRILIGVGPALRMYEIGKKKLLRKCESRKFPNLICSIHTEGERIFVGDAAESFSLLRFNSLSNSFELFAEDRRARWLTVSCPLDFDTVAGADKFGNLFICRIPEEAATELEEEADAVQVEAHLHRGAKHKLDEVAHVFLGETILGLQRSALVQGGTEAVIYGTILGGLGALQPFVSKEDVDFFLRLEMLLRGNLGVRESVNDKSFDNPSLCGNDQLGFRSYFSPMRGVVDGDLCESFHALDSARQLKVAAELDKTPEEVAKKIEDMRTRLL